jgi:phosphate transport system substrate-binding protein
MKRFILITVLFLSVTWFADCDREEAFEGIEDLTFDNFPKMDGSTSARHLNTIIACKLLDIPYTWYGPGVVTEWSVSPVYPEWESGERETYLEFFSEKVKTSQTHGAFMNLIDGNADIILTHRTASPDEKAHAGETGVTLLETPVAMDAFVFVVSRDNPVKSLTVEQIRKIYTGEITNWAQAGGNDATIKVFTRPRNSGSEEVMRELVMNGLEMADFPESPIGGMAQVFREIMYNPDGICYTFNNYKELIARTADKDVPKIAVNGIFPGDKTIKDRTYPFISEVHVAIRSDLDHKTMAYRLYEWMQSEAAKSTISECGFIPK